MNRAKTALLVLALIVPIGWASSGCTKDYCDTGETAIDDTGDTTYQGARRRAPDNGWRVHVER